MTPEIIVAIAGLCVALVTFIVGRISAASTLGKKQGEIETRIQRIEDDIRGLKCIQSGCNEKYMSKDSFNSAMRRVDEGIRGLEVRLDDIYKFLMQRTNGE